MRSKLVVPALLAVLAALPAAAPAMAQTRTEILSLGRRTAETWCANCHLIGPQAGGPAGDAAPPFHAVAAMPSTTELSLRAFLRTPHARMPDYQLSNAELEGVIACILSLRAAR